MTSVKETTSPWGNATRPVAERVELLLGSMTPEQKAAQLGSYWRPHGTPDEQVAPMEGALSDRRQGFADYIRHGLGQLTRVFGSVPVTAAEGVADLLEMQRQVVEAPDGLGIPALAHEECLTGFTTLGATVYPTPLAWGATFDPDLIAEMSRAIGRDLRTVGVHQGLSPVLDVTRDYRWGRTEETIGEDPYLVGTIGTAYVQGLQSAGIIATLKHFVGYSASRAARNHAPVPIGRRELADVLLVPFEMAIREGRAKSVMNSYADVDGMPPAASRELLTTLLREHWGFTGTVVSDYWAISFLEMMHKVAAGPAEAARLALTAGLDVELPETEAFAHLPGLVRAGELDESLLDGAVRRVLTQKAELGLLDDDWAPPPAGSTVDLDHAGNRALARRIAEQSVVLVANDGVLPLARGRRIALIGPSAAEPRCFLGCYSFPNHVLSRHRSGDNGIEIPTLLESMRIAWPVEDISHEPGCGFTGDDRSGLAAAVEAAAAADVAVVVVGDIAGLFGRGTSGEGCDAPDLALPGVQGDLVDAVLDTGTPLVLVVVSGRPYALGRYADRCSAIMQAFLPGEEGGPALAGILTGTVEPTGRLPVGIPRDPGGQPGTYLAAPLGLRTDGISNLDPTPLFPFGHGLSYSRVEYGRLSADRTEMDVDGTVELSVQVRNTGERPCAEVVQLYLSDPVAQVVRPVRQLVGYARVPLTPGQARTVSFGVHADRTSFTGRDLHRVVEPGVLTFAVGPSSADLAAAVDVRVVGEERAVTGARVLLTPTRVSG
ncbi:MAG TPA: glycoside hydrolase family 3 N-terminal domain-containing protein [Nakamurella sp.]